MRCPWLFALLIAFASALERPSAAPADPAHARLGAVLARFVTNGLVDYAALRADPGDLDAYLDSVAKVEAGEFADWSRNERLALLLNLYNAQTLRLILDHYPVKSIRRIGLLPGAAWKKATVRWGGNTISLDDLEHRILRPGYREPRIHFALVCAAKGCPPLRSEPYQAAKLDAQLDDQARQFLTNAAKNRFDAKEHRLWLSPIFDWYGEDFGAGSEDLIRYVATYLSPDTRSQLSAAASVKVGFTDYDWSLNEWVPPQRHVAD